MPKPLKAVTEDDQKFLDAAGTVLTMFKRREITASTFNMETFAGNKVCSTDGVGCKTSHCIGGWIDYVMGGSGAENPANNLDLSLRIKENSSALFYPITYGAMRSKPKHGRAALENFLAGYKNPWSKVDLKDKA